MPLALFGFNYFSDRVLCFFPGAGLGPTPPTYLDSVACVTIPGLFVEMGVSLTF
jgi:hypothetical protein